MDVFNRDINCGKYWTHVNCKLLHVITNTDRYVVNT